MMLLHRLSRRGRFRLPQFDLAPLRFALEEEPEELLLDAPLATPGQAPVQHLVRPNSTPGELVNSIERHLESRRANPPADAAEELKNALADLRRSLG